MRRILIESARRKQAHKHGGDRQRIDLAEIAVAGCVTPHKLLELDDALNRLAQHDATAAELTKLRIFAGLSVEQAGTALGLSRTEAYRQWTYARAWLRAQFA
jgi:RNA polymerase sigma factor (TIGR02999 family)